MGFIRRYTSDPGLSELLAIEGQVVIDREPPTVISGVGSGATICVGEFEDGPFNTPTELSSGTDLQNQFGGFGYTYSGVPSQNCCARGRKADSALAYEYWNGNGFIALVNKRFARLMVTRVDTSVGSVRFSRQAYLTSLYDNFAYKLTSGQILSFDIGGGSLPATFTGVVAARASATGSYPTLFTGGEKFNVTIDEGTPYQIGPIDVVFQDADETQAAVITRINEFLGFTCAVSTSATVLTMSGRCPGTTGNVKINSADAAVTTKTGITVGTTAGTGNVADINQVSIAEIASLVSTASSATVKIQQDANGKLRAYNVSTTLASTITVHSATTASALGFTVGATANNSVGTAGKIPAGTRVRNAGGTEWVTMQTINVAASVAGPYDVKVRPADDEGVTGSAATGTVNVVPYAIEIGAFGVSNLLPLSAALSEAAIDAAYVTAFASTLATNSVARQANIIFSARQSNVCRATTRQNVRDAFSKGALGRIGVVRPPLNTLRSVAKSTSSQPGVGATRDRSIVYAYPGVNTYVPQIATRGLDGGAGFTATGYIDVGFDSWIAATCSQLPPEENPGQRTDFMLLATAIEVGNADVQSMTMDDYIGFKAAGIAAPILDDGVMTIQSGVVSVDPLINPGLKNIARARMAMFIQDSLALAAKRYEKKLNRKVTRADILGIANGFLSGLKSENQEDLQRIDDYSLDGKSANTPDTLALGLYRVRVCVRTLSSLDVIVWDTTIGETVTIEEVSVEN